MTSTIRTLNKLVGVEPFPQKAVKPVTLKGGLIGVAQKVELTPLKVMVPSEDGRFTPGMTVYVRGDLSAQDFSGNIQTIAGLTFILLPESYVQLVIDAPL
jgi:hypothetical protein